MISPGSLVVEENLGKKNLRPRSLVVPAEGVGIIISAHIAAIGLYVSQVRIVLRSFVKPRCTPQKLVLIEKKKKSYEIAKIDVPI